MKKNLLCFSLTCIFMLTNLGAQAQSKKKPGKPTKQTSNSQRFSTEMSLPQILEKAEPVVENKLNGQINWTEQYVEAKGESVIDNERFKNPAQARAMATRGAVVVAQRNLLEIINGVHIVGETTVEDMIATSDKIQSRVDGVIKGAIQVGDAVVKDGLVTVTMRVPLYQKNGLAPAVYEEVEKVVEKEYKVEETPVVVQEPVTAKDTAEFKQFAFRINGKKVEPSMFPIVSDEKGNVLLDYSKLYDPKKGDFPKYLQLSKDILETTGFKKGVQVIDLIQGQDGKLVVSEEVKKKINWSKVGNVLSKIGKVALMLL
ncbi:MAG: hypothetical protein SNJ77_02215 [Cytophagales bacterium]